MTGTPRASPASRSLLWKVLFWPFSITGTILFYIASMLRLTGNTHRVGIEHGRRKQRQDPKTCAELFKRVFEARYGDGHPEFSENSYVQTLEDSRRELRFLLVYLHSEEHDDSDQFCREVLASDALCSYLRENQFKFWAGDIQDQEAFQGKSPVSLALSTTLQAMSYPFLAVIALHMPGAATGASVLSRSAKMTVVDRVEGVLEANKVTRRLRRAVDRYGAQLEVARAELRQREMNRQLMEQQEHAYQASLQADREKERRARDARERAQREQAEAERAAIVSADRERKRNAYQRYLLATLPSEPVAGEANTTRIGFRLPDGSRVVRRFRGSDMVNHVFAFVDTLSVDESTLDLTTTSPPEDYTHQFDFILVSPMPRVDYTADDPEATVASIEGWWPSVNLVVEPVDLDA